MEASLYSSRTALYGRRNCFQAMLSNHVLGQRSTTVEDRWKHRDRRVNIAVARLTNRLPKEVSEKLVLRLEFDVCGVVTGSDVASKPDAIL